ncbi:MAG: FAD:protein FMN transferase, partial [Bacteroidota bacterium]|nr:FAD:protein FMN transferase [Bacteroidota bacterium]
MGSPFHIILIDEDSAKASAIARSCFQMVDSFNRLFSDYDTTSELSKLNAQAGKHPVKISSGLWDMIQLSKKAYQLSKGVFDITVAPLSSVWRKARKYNQFPDENLLKSTRRWIGFSKLVLDSLEHSVYLPFKGMRLDLGGIAKGYTAEKLVRFIQSRGIQKCLVDAGGDMVMGEAAANSGGWTIGVNIPETTDELLPDKLQLQNKAVATSGDAYQYIAHNGKKYSHIINPLTG